MKTSIIIALFCTIGFTTEGVQAVKVFKQEPPVQGDSPKTDEKKAEEPKKDIKEVEKKADVPELKEDKGKEGAPVDLKTIEDEGKKMK